MAAAAAATEQSNADGVDPRPLYLPSWFFNIFDAVCFPSGENRLVSDDAMMMASARSPEIRTPCARVRSTPHVRSSPRSRVTPTP
jgi:hypothetical protein